MLTCALYSAIKIATISGNTPYYFLFKTFLHSPIGTKAGRPQEYRLKA